MAVTGAMGFGAFEATGTLGVGIMVGTYSGSALVAGTVAGAVGGFVGSSMGVLIASQPDDLAKAFSLSNIRANSDAVLAYGALGAAGGALAAGLGTVLSEAVPAFSAMAPFTREIATNTIGDLASQGLSIAAGAADSLDFTSALVSSTFASVAGRAEPALKKAGQALLPMSGATARQQLIISAFAKRYGYDIGIRSADPLTALGTRLLTEFAPATVQSKPLSVKTKSTFGLLRAEVEGKMAWLRSDLDVAYIRDRTTGQFLSESEVIAIGQTLNERFVKSGASKNEAFMHGAHFTAREYYEQALTDISEAWGKVGKIGHPGPVTVFGTDARQLKAAQVRDYALREQLDWHSAWDVSKPLPVSGCMGSVVTVTGLERLADIRGYTLDWSVAK
jgi:hypothetical protein